MMRETGVAYTVVEFDQFRFDTRRLMLLRRDGSRVALTHKACELLNLLLSRPGEVVLKRDIFAHLWPDGCVEESNLTQTVYVLRQTLGDSHGRIIQTVPRAGYLLVSSVRPHVPPDLRRRFLFGVPAVALALIVILTISSGLWSKAGKSALLPTGALKAYEVGRLSWAAPTRQNLERSRALFLSVTREVPASPLGFAGLSDTYYSLSTGTLNQKLRRQYMRLAKSYATRALALDQSSSEAHLAMARALQNPSTASQAEREFQTALALDARNSLAHRWYGIFCLNHARYACATSELSTANALDPQAWQNLYWLGASYYYARDYARAVTTLREAMRIQPSQPNAELLLAFSWEELGRTRDRDLVLDHLAAERYDDAELGAIKAFNLARHGYAQAAAQKLAPILRMPASRVPGAITVAGTLVELGQIQKAHWWLKYRYTPDDASIYPMRDPRLDNVRRELFSERPG